MADHPFDSLVARLAADMSSFHTNPGLQKLAAMARQSRPPVDGEDVRDPDSLLRSYRRAQQQSRTRRGIMRAQGREIRELRRKLAARERQLEGGGRTNTRLAHDLIEARDFIWTIAGARRSPLSETGNVGGSVQHRARSLLLRARSTEKDRQS